jgi:hypothetical protein
MFSAVLLAAYELKRCDGATTVSVIACWYNGFTVSDVSPNDTKPVALIVVNAPVLGVVLPIGVELMDVADIAPNDIELVVEVIEPVTCNPVDVALTIAVPLTDKELEFDPLITVFAPLDAKI